MPGPGWHLPRPIETHETINFTGIRSVEKRTTMLTQDENIVELAFSVQYRIKNAEDYLFNVENPDIVGDRTCRFGSRSTICGVLDSAIRDVVGKNKMDYILREGRTEISNRTEDLMQQVLDSYKSGIQVVTVNLQDSQPPDAVQDAFQDATKAREDMERYKNLAQAYANEIVPQARGEAARMIQDALAYKERVIANAEGDADRFLKVLKEYKRAPEVTRKRLYMDALESVLSNSSKLMIDIKDGNNLMLLPLDKIINAEKLDEGVTEDEEDEEYTEDKTNVRESR
jgi:membrane protease subunit HflK